MATDAEVPLLEEGLCQAEAKPSAAASTASGALAGSSQAIPAVVKASSKTSA